MNKRIIAFSGRKHSGKTLLSEICKNEYGYQVLYFADGLKNLVCELMNINRSVLDSMKDVPQEINLFDSICYLTENLNLEGKNAKELMRLQTPFSSIREVLQFLGTEIIRKYSPTWHIDQLRRSMTSDKICIGDCRFPDEKEFVEQLGGETWIVIRPYYLDDISNHSSEISLQWPVFSSRVIINDKDISALSSRWQSYMNTGLWTPSPYLKQSMESAFNETATVDFIKRSNIANAKRMACIIDNPLILENMKLLL